MSVQKTEADSAVSEELFALVHHLADILAEEFVLAMKEEEGQSDASSSVCEVL